MSNKPLPRKKKRLTEFLLSEDGKITRDQVVVVSTFLIAANAAAAIEESVSDGLGWIILGMGHIFPILMDW